MKHNLFKKILEIFRERNKSMKSVMLLATPNINFKQKNRLYRIGEVINKWEKELLIIKRTVENSAMTESSLFEHKSRYIVIQEIIDDLHKLISEEHLK